MRSSHSIVAAVPVASVFVTGRAVGRRVSPRGSAGFTLVELLVAMALMTVLTTMIATMLINAEKMYRSSMASARMTAEVRVALDVIGRDLARIETTTAYQPLPIGHNAPVPTNIQPLGIALRSRPMVPQAQWNTPAETANYVAFRTTPVATPDAAVDANAILSFYAQAQYFVDDPQGPRIATTLSRIVYFLMARPDAGGQPRPGAFLIRRVEPFTVEPVQNNPGQWTVTWETPIEDAVCSFVRGAEVYYLDRRPLNLHIGGNPDRRYIEARNGAVPAPEAVLIENNRVIFRLDPNWRTNATPFQQKDFLPPSILLELFMVDETGDSFREIRRVYNFEVSPPQLPRKN